MGKLLINEGLGEVIQHRGYSDRTVRSLTLLLAGKGSNQERSISLRNTRREVRWNVSTRLQQLIQCSIDEHIIREAGLYGLVNVEHIGFVVEGPRIQGSAISVVVEVAGSTHHRGAEHGALANTTRKVYDQGSVLGVLASFEVPEEHGVIVRLLEDGGWEVNIAAVGFDSGSSLTEMSLVDLVSESQRRAGAVSTRAKKKDLA